MNSHDSLFSLFSALDTVLSLHYASSITTPKLNDICVKATNMSGTRIDASTIEMILRYFPQAYKVISHGRNTFDYFITVPADVPIWKFGTQLPLRKRQFVDLVKDATETPKRVSLAAIAEAETPLKSPQKALLSSIKTTTTNTSLTKSSPTKTSPAKVIKVSDLRNDLSKFLFKEKISAIQLSNANGLSLLERIKLKEKQRRSHESPQAKYQAQIEGKMPAVYDVIYELAHSLNLETGAPKSRSFLLHKIISIVRDSLTFEIAESEVQDVIHELASRLGQEKIQVLQRGGVKALKVYQLDREADLVLIN